MAESIQFIIDEKSKRKRHIDSVLVDEQIKLRLKQTGKSRVVYEGEEGEDLEEVRSKMKNRDDLNLQIRNGKIYEVRRRLKKMEVIQKTIRETIVIMKEKELVKSDKSVDDLSKIVFNKFLNGTERKKYSLSKK